MAISDVVAVPLRSADLGPAALGLVMDGSRNRVVQCMDVAGLQAPTVRSLRHEGVMKKSYNVGCSS